MGLAELSQLAMEVPQADLKMEPEKQAWAAKAVVLVLERVLAWEWR